MFCILGCGCMKQYNIRLEPTDVNLLDGLGGCRSVHIRTAISKYLHDGIQKSDTIDDDGIVMDYIQELKSDKDILQKRLDYLMLPWYHRILLPRVTK